MSPHISTNALIIDVDCISPKHFLLSYQSASSIGKLGFHFISGKEANMKGWDKASTGYSPKQVIAPDGKNMAEIIIVDECINLLELRPEIDTFCIVSNDKRFARIGRVLRRLRKRVILMGTDTAAKILKNDFEFILLKTNNE